MRKVKLMNSAMMPLAGIYNIQQISIEEFVSFLENEFESYIGYPDTARMVEKIFASRRPGRQIEVPVSREQTALEDGDMMLIIRLRYRVANPGQKGKFTPGEDDFDFFKCDYRFYEEPW